MSNEWATPEHALAYLRKADRIPHRTGRGGAAGGGAAGRPPCAGPRVGRRQALLALLLVACPAATDVAVESSPPMLDRLRERFGGGAGGAAGNSAGGSAGRVEVVAHDLERPLPPLGTFDVAASSFAIHHVPHARKRELYGEVWAALEPGGVFCKLEHVASPTPRLHARFLDAPGITPAQADPSNKLPDVETQLRWLRETGHDDLDCPWKWREPAPLAARKPRR